MKEVVDSTAVPHKYCDNLIEVQKKGKVLQHVFFNDAKLLTRYFKLLLNYQKKMLKEEILITSITYITNWLGHEKFTSSCTFDSISWQIEIASICVVIPILSI